MAGDDDARHRREEEERRAKRKASKMNMSEAAKEKERKRKEHAQRVLQKHGGGAAKRPKPPSGPPPPTDVKSEFQELFAQRAQGFQIDFRFRNAPPRPPVGPCFVGSGLDGVLQDISQYKPMNAVEAAYRFKLHSEPDLGVPLAPSAMDLKSYKPVTTEPPLHPDDDALLNWKGSMGDTAAEELKQRKDYARAAARLALSGKSPAKLLEKQKTPPSSSTSRKAFSRVLDETMQSWMKKTTYLSNDFTRKVHDFKSLATTKAEQEKDLDEAQKMLKKRREPAAISKTFAESANPIVQHPTKKHLKPVHVMPLLPDQEHWGSAFTHVVLDKSPADPEGLDRAFIADVEKKDANARMTCKLYVPREEKEDEVVYEGTTHCELDVVPLKEEDAPYVNFCILIDREAGKASYLPISSRVQLSGGRPLKKGTHKLTVARRPLDAEEELERDERVAEIDRDVEDKISKGGGGKSEGQTKSNGSGLAVDSDDDSDDSDDQQDSFVNTTKTIVAEG